MTFRHRLPLTPWKKIRNKLWPSMGLVRLVKYYKHRMGRLPGTPRYIALGFATGIAVSFTPFIGFHLAAAGLIVWMLRGSLMAMALGTLAAGNPWTYPFIWVATYQLGKFMLGEKENGGEFFRLSHGFTLSDLLQKPMELLLPMTLGSIPLGVLSWTVSFYFVRHIIKRYKEARLARIHKH